MSNSLDIISRTQSVLIRNQYGTIIYEYPGPKSFCTKERALILAKEVAKKSTCLRLHVGAILLDKESKIISTGYNRNRDNSICPHCPRIERNAEHGSAYTDCDAIHAEQDAIENAISNGKDLRGTKGTENSSREYLESLGPLQIVISHSACPDCVRLLDKYNISVV